MHWAAAYGHLAIAKRLLEGGADPTLRDEWGKTAIDLAREEGKSEVVALLSEHRYAAPPRARPRSSRALALDDAACAAFATAHRHSFDICLKVRARRVRPPPPRGRGHRGQRHGKPRACPPPAYAMGPLACNHSAWPLVYNKYVDTASKPTFAAKMCSQHATSLKLPRTHVSEHT